MKKIMIIGGGEIGSFLAERLIAENMEVTVMDEDPDTVQNLSNRIDAACLVGNGANIRDLIRAGAGAMDLFISATNLDDANLIACLLARELGVPNKIAVTRQMDATHLNRKFQTAKLGIDLMINVSEAVRDELMLVVEESGVSEIASFSEGRFVLIGHQIDEKSFFAGRTVEEVTGAENRRFFQVAAVVRQEKLVISSPGLMLELGDYIYFTVTQEHFSNLQTVLHVEGFKERKAVIVGDGHLPYLLASSLLARHFQVTVLTGDEKSAEELRRQFVHRPKFRAEVGDGTEIRILKRIKVPSVSHFFAITPDDSTNLTACMVAKYLGVGKTLALIKRNDILTLSQKAGVDVSIAPRLAAAKLVQKAVHMEKLLDYRPVTQLDLEVVELEAREGSKVTKGTIGHLKLPEGTIIGGIVSKGVADLPHPKRKIQAGDQVIVLTEADKLMNLEGFFGL
ncbi:MAG: Trk system potassium transporter TrkA [Deltaproteobacteria bacterium]|nr:Trk system potassium transporter TrkA [Deltaproteobacteria bacterium]